LGGSTQITGVEEKRTRYAVDFGVIKATFDDFFWPGRLHQVGAARSILLRPTYSILAHPVVSVFCQLSPKRQKYQNFPYKKAVRKWLR
jgi:hypothetical protein